MSVKTKTDTAPPSTVIEEATSATANPIALSPAEQARALAVVDYGDDAGAGMQNIKREEVRVPLFRVLQGLSPQVKPPAQGGIDGAKIGMLFNTGTGELFEGDPGVEFVPCWRDQNYVEYIPRDAGGGFVGTYKPTDDIVYLLHAIQGRFGRLKIWGADQYKEEAKRKGIETVAIGDGVAARRIKIADAIDIYEDLGVKGGTELVETFYLYGLFLIDEWTTVQGVAPWTSTQIGKYQAFIGKYLAIKYPNPANMLVRPPLWAHKWLLGSGYQKSKKGDFYGWNLRTVLPGKPILSRIDRSEPLYEEARSFYEMLIEGVASADLSADAKVGGQESDQGSSSSSGGPKPSVEDDEIPF